MIFVTVGTHEQPFDRLIKKIDILKKEDIIKEKVIVQTGFSTYIPRYCAWTNMFSYNEMEKNIAEARIVITHGGPASFIMPLQIGKIPIVVPRQFAFNEHINNHQVDFVEAVATRMRTIIPINDIEKLGETLENYDIIISCMKLSIQKNNKKFNCEFEKIINNLF